MPRFSLSFSLLLGLFLASAALADEKRGRDIAEKVYNRSKGKDSLSIAQMVLVSRSGRKRTRSLKIYERRPKKGMVDTLIRFTGPKNIKDTGLLTSDRIGKETDQWVYLPELKKSRRITSSGKGGRFAGSDFYYEDLQDRPVSKDRHVFLKKTKFEGIETLLLESRPVKKKNSVYQKRRSWIHPELWIPLKIEFYKKGRKHKTMLSKKIENISGIWTVMESHMTSHKNGHQTVIQKSRMNYNVGIKKGLFSQKVLSDPAREKSMQ